MATWYRDGTVSVTNGSTAVTGVQTLWTTQISQGDLFTLDASQFYEVASITDDTHLVLKSAYLGATASAQNYAVIRNFTATLPAQLAANLADLMTDYHDTLDELTAWLSGTGTVTVHDGAGNAYQVKTPAQLSSESTGMLSKSVAGGADVTLTTAEAANTFVDFTGTLTANINVIVPATSKRWVVRNSTSGTYTLTVKTASGTGKAITQGKAGELWCDGTNVLLATDAIDGVPIGQAAPAAGSFTTLSATGLVSNTGGDFSTSGSSGSVDYGFSVGVSGVSAGKLGFNHSGSANAFGAPNDTMYLGMAQGYPIVFTTSASEKMRLDVNGNLGLGVTPSAWSAANTAIDIGNSAHVSGNSALTFSQNAFYSLGWLYKSTGVASQYYLASGSHVWSIAASGTAGNPITWDQAMTIDSSGHLLVGVTSGSNHILRKEVAAGNTIFEVQGTPGAIVSFMAVDSWGASATNTALFVGANTATSRSINAGGTINASGADYAEYMTKADICGTLAKGQIVGINVSGQLTDKWSESVSFLIKSTNPSYVGGDVWGTESAIGMPRPVEPVFVPPAYAGSSDPGPAPAKPIAPVPLADNATNATNAEKAVYEQALSDYNAALDAYQTAYKTWDSARATFELDQSAYKARVDNARQIFNTATYPTYQQQLATFNAALETARQKVDRIAYSGQVPVNVQGATPGQYVVPVQDGDGIGGRLVNDADITFQEYRRAVGVVQNILPDGRANVRVKVA